MAGVSRDMVTEAPYPVTLAGEIFTRGEEKSPQCHRSDI
jgi:hypothetical protein